MKQKNYRRIWVVAGVVALSLCLTGCYIPPDEISDGTQDMTVGANSFPFDTVQATTGSPTPTPTATPTLTPPGSGGVINNPWSTDDWSTTQNPGSSTSQPGGTVTQSGVIVTTGSPTNTPTSKPTDRPTDTPAPTSLRVGATGSDVRALQKRLKELGYYTGSVDGDFGTGTENAVKAFQKQCGLTADGVVGNQTKSRLNASSAPTAPRATKTPTARPTATPTARPTNTPSYDTDTYLELGASGKDVRQLQERLISLGWLAGKADSYFGGATEYAVKAFQSRAGLWDDGVAGPDTLKKLYSSSAPSTSTTQASIGESLKEGMEGKAVRALQIRLKNLGYLSGSVDGSFGAATKSAVTTFQKQNGLTADGVAGTATLNKIYSDTAKKYSGSGSGSGSSSGNGSGSGSGSSSGSNTGSSGKVDTSDIVSTGYITLREGDKSDAVTQLQRRLKNLGFYTGYVDGTYGSGTTAAVKAFQTSKNLKADGIAGPATQRALYGTSSTLTYATLRPGDEGSGVKNMQYTLYELGYYDDKIDGIYGDTTSFAVREFQIANKLSPVDGIAGNKTLQALYSEDPVAYTEPASEYETLRPGDKGVSVLEMQEALYQLGYLASITGKYDDATEAAVRNFQTYNGLSVDGTAGNQTLKKLYSGSAKAYPGN